MNWIHLAIGAISLVREMLKLVSSDKEKKRKRLEQLHALRDGLKKAREEGKTDELERLVSIMSNDLGDK